MTELANALKLLWEELEAAAFEGRPHRFTFEECSQVESALAEIN